MGDLDEITSVDDAEELIKRLRHGPELCEWCLTRLRYRVDRDDEAWALSAGPRTEAFRARGHEVTSDGGVEPAPDYVIREGLTTERVPTFDDGQGDVAVPCPYCGRVDGMDSDECWEDHERHHHLDNLLEALGLDDVDDGPAHDVVSEGNKHDDTDNLPLLARALYAVLESNK